MQRDDALLERAAVAPRATVGVERERRAVEDQFVLAADLVEVDQRQAALGDAGAAMSTAARRSCRAIGRAVRHQQDFRAGLGEHSDVFIDSPQMSSQIGTPMRTPLTRPGPASGPREHALLVEHAVVRQVDLEAQAAMRP